MTGMNDERLYVQDKRDESFDDLLAVGVVWEENPTPLRKNRRGKNKKVVGSRLPDDSPKVRMSIDRKIKVAMLATTQMALLFILLAGGH